MPSKLMLLAGAAALFAATLIPLAAASHAVCVQRDYEDNVCAQLGSDRGGSCSDGNGYEWSRVSVYRYAWPSNDYRDAQLGYGCEAYSSEWNGVPESGKSNGVSFVFYGYDELGQGDQTSVSWAQWSGTYGDSTYGGCDTQVDAEGNWEDLGCPAGGPPALPALLP